METKIDLPICEACNKNKSIGVCSMPCVPASFAYCKECLDADNHPMGSLIANTACIGGYHESNDTWRAMVNNSLKHQGKTIEWFKEQVELSIKKELKEENILKGIDNIKEKTKADVDAVFQLLGESRILILNLETTLQQIREKSETIGYESGDSGILALANNGLEFIKTYEGKELE